MGTEIVKCECEHIDHDEVRCLRPPAVIVQTDFGKFALCLKCYHAMHMSGISNRSIYKVAETL